jgi:hypothetical protein
MRFMTSRRFSVCIWAGVLILIFFAGQSGFAQNPEAPYLPELALDEDLLEGVIDRFEDEEIVINDRLYILTPDTRFNTVYMQDVQRDLFTPGKRVEYIVNKNKEIRAICLMN